MTRHSTKARGQGITDRQEKMPKGFAQRSGDFGRTWEPKVGESLTCHVTDYKQDVKTRTKSGKSDVLAVVDTNTGELLTVWISAGLKGRVTPKDKGRTLYLKRLADRPTRKGRNPMKAYAVGVK